MKDGVEFLHLTSLNRVPCKVIRFKRWKLLSFVLDINFARVLPKVVERPTPGDNFVNCNAEGENLLFSHIEVNSCCSVPGCTISSTQLEQGARRFILTKGRSCLRAPGMSLTAKSAGGRKGRWHKRHVSERQVVVELIISTRSSGHRIISVIPLHLRRETHSPMVCIYSQRQAHHILLSEYHTSIESQPLSFSPLAQGRYFHHSRLP